MHTLGSEFVIVQIKIFNHAFFKFRKNLTIAFLHLFADSTAIFNLVQEKYVVYTLLVQTHINTSTSA